jgi:methylaspartate mutase epsilon subunit
MEIRNKRLSHEEFKQERREVLAKWPTGKEVDFDEAVDFQKSLLPDKNCAKKLALAKETGAMLIRSDSGVPSLEEQTEYLQYLQDEGGSDLLGVIIDSFTRNWLFEEAEQGLEKSLQTGKWLINGFPIVHYGVAETRKLTEAVNLPLHIRGVAPDWRFISEIGIAAGYTGTGGAPIISFSQFSADLPLEVAIHNYQYMFRLIGYYEEAGVPIVAEISGGVGVLTPNSLTHAATIIDALTAAEQGVKNICLMVHTQGNLAQDAAAMIILPKLCQEYLNRFGYRDVTLTVVTTSWSGKFPEDFNEALASICLSVAAAVFGKAQLAHVKTTQEAITIPQKEANAASLRAGKMVINMLKDQKIQLDNKVMEIEIKMQKLETKAIVDKVLELGDGDAVVGAIRAVGSGVLDQVFATNKYVASRVMGVRDNEGAVRYLDHGNLPFTNEIIEFHRGKIAEREKARGRKVDYESVVHDLFSVSRGSFW